MSPADAFTTGTRTITPPTKPAPSDQPAWNTQKNRPMPTFRYRPFAEEVETVTLPDRTCSTRSSTEHPSGVPLTCATATRR